MPRLFRRAAYVERRPDIETRTTALPPPPRRKGKTDKKTALFEKKEIEKNDDEAALLDEKMIVIEEKEMKAEQSGIIGRRHVRRQVIWEDFYKEKEAFEEEGTRKKNWWMKTLTACMPSGDQ